MRVTNGLLSSVLLLGIAGCGGGGGGHAGTSGSSPSGSGVRASARTASVASTTVANKSVVVSSPAPAPAPSFPSHHTDSVTAILFSSDGRTVQTAGIDGWVLTWDTTTRAVIGGAKVFDEQTGSPVGVAFADNGRILTGWNYGTLTAWEIARPQTPLYTIAGLAKTTFSWDGSLIAGMWGGEQPGCDAIFDARTGQHLFEVADGGTGNLEFSPDGSLARARGAITFFDNTGRVAGVDSTANMGDYGAFSYDGRSFVSWNDTQLGIWDVSLAKPIAHLTTAGSISFASLAPDGRTLLVAAPNDGQTPLLLVDSTSGVTVGTIPADGFLFTATAFSRDGKLLVTSDRWGKVELRDVGQLLAK